MALRSSPEGGLARGWGHLQEFVGPLQEVHYFLFSTILSADTVLALMTTPELIHVLSDELASIQPRLSEYIDAIQHMAVMMRRTDRRPVVENSYDSVRGGQLTYARYSAIIELAVFQDRLLACRLV